jgi:tRNA threonylcarbamoyladenosine biosynthesis protein TsaB
MRGIIMKILYLDTSSSFLCAAILEDDKVLEQNKDQLGNNLSSHTLPRVEEMLKVNNVKVDDIGKIICVNGPGSFTGIRIGLTIAKTMAWSKKIPIIAISSLEAMALSSDGDYNYIVPAIDARRNFVYSTIYDTQNKNFIMEEKHISLDTLQVVLSNLVGSISFVSNDKLDVDYDVQPYDPKIEKIVKEFMNKEPVNPHSIDANYLKLTEAEEKKMESENK